MSLATQNASELRIDRRSRIDAHGVIHLHGGGQLADADRAAIAAVDEVWLQVEPDPFASPLIAQLGTDTSQALSVIAGEQRWGRVVAACVTLGLDHADLDMLRPWLAAQTLDATLGRATTDDEIRALAGGRIRYEMALEGAVRLFAGLDDAAQFGLLDWTLDLVEGAEAWPTEQQEARLRKVAPQFHQRFLVARNRDWLLRIEDLANAGTSAFVSLGPLHLVGADGIVALAAERELTLTHH